MPTIRVLSIKQPWATLIVRGVKRFEARTWPPRWRGRIAIHASSSTISKKEWKELLADAEAREALATAGLCDHADVQALPKSAIVGAASVEEARISLAWPLEECTALDRELSSWWPSMILWRLVEPVEFTPITGVNGRLNLWSLTGAEATAVLRRDSSGEAWSGTPHDDSAVEKARDAEQAELEYSEAFPDRTVSIPAELRKPLGTRARARVADAYQALFAEIFNGQPSAFGPPWDQQVPVTGPIGALLFPGRRRAKLLDVCKALAERLTPDEPAPGYLMQFLSAGEAATADVVDDA
jgi:hypothetical protein